jgi:hypothetical protein
MRVRRDPRLLADLHLMANGCSRTDSAKDVRELEPGVRRLVSATAARRSELELQGAAAFAVATQAAIDLRADSTLVDLCAKAAVEEIEHSGIYLSIARQYALGDVVEPRAQPIVIPEYPATNAAEQSLLLLVGLCSINETMACAFLQCCLAGATAPAVREGLHRVLEDEIRHARIGWMALGTSRVGDTERRLVSRWLMPMLRAQWQGWTEQIASLPPGESPEHGCPGAARIREVARASVLGLVLPGFARAGVDVSTAHAWFTAQG